MQMRGGGKKKKEKETLWMLIAAATDTADEADLAVKMFYYCHRASVLVQPRPGGWAIGLVRGNDQCIQLLRHELRSATPVS